MSSAALKAEVQPEIDWQALIEEGTKKFLDQVDWSQNAAAIFITPKGGFLNYQGSVCHHFLYDKCAKFIINGLQDGEEYGDNIGRILPKEVELWYLDWLLNRSPYADAFITKDAEKALETRIVVSSGDHPGNYVGGSIVSLRLLWEHTYAAQAAYDLHKAGVHEDVAFLLGHTVSVERKITPDSPTEWTNNTSWHSSIDVGTMGFKGVKKFMAHEPTTKTGIYAKQGQFSGYSAMYRSADTSLTAYIRANFPYERYRDAPKAAVNTNPFMASKAVLEPARRAGGHSAPYYKAIEVMAEWAQTHLMEKINAA